MKLRRLMQNYPRGKVRPAWHSLFFFLLSLFLHFPACLVLALAVLMTTHHHPPSSTSHPPNVSFTTPQVACHSPSQHDDHTALQKSHTPVSCPRCDSLETKFCYFNNYNVKQPRHFCRSCQRYWTAGGALRNLPIGAGRRKTKNCVISGNPRSEAVIQRSDHLEAAQRLQFSNITGDDVNPGLEIPVTDIFDSRSVSSGLQSFPQQQHCNSSLVFPSGPPIRSAMERSEQESAFGFKDRENGIRGLNVSESDTLLAPGSPVDAVQNDDSILCSSVTASSSSPLSEGDSILLSEGGTSTLSNMELTEGFSAPTGWDGAVLPLVLPFPYVLNNAAAYPGAADGLFPLPPVFTPLWTPFGWGVPLNFAWNANAAAAAAATLGKRQRPPAEKQGSLCVPKTLRVDHPEEAAQSSILTSLGFGGVPALSPTSNCFHNAFQREAAVLHPKTEVGNSNMHVETQHLHTNPAAQARSIAFQEGN